MALMLLVTSHFIMICASDIVVKGYLCEQIKDLYLIAGAWCQRRKGFAAQQSDRAD